MPNYLNELFEATNPEAFTRFGFQKILAIHRNPPPPRGFLSVCPTSHKLAIVSIIVLNSISSVGFCYGPGNHQKRYKINKVFRTWFLKWTQFHKSKCPNTCSAHIVKPDAMDVVWHLIPTLLWWESILWCVQYHSGSWLWKNEPT